MCNRIQAILNGFFSILYLYNIYFIACYFRDLLSYVFGEDLAGGEEDNEVEEKVVILEENLDQYEENLDKSEENLEESYSPKKKQKKNKEKRKRQPVWEDEDDEETL